MLHFDVGHRIAKLSCIKFISVLYHKQHTNIYFQLHIPLLLTFIFITHCFLTPILHLGLKQECVLFQVTFAFSIFYFQFDIPFLFGLLSIFCQDFDISFFYSFDSSFGLYFFSCSFSHGRGLILDIFQVNFFLFCKPLMTSVQRYVFYSIC